MPAPTVDELVAKGPPIAQSSVPRCPCANEHPCACERYARRLELRYQSDQKAVLGADRKLAIAEASLRGADLHIDGAIALAAVSAARELLQL